MKSQNLEILGAYSSPVKSLLGLFVISILTPPGKAAVACLINRNQAKRNSGLVAYREVIKVLPLVLMAGIIWYLGTIIGLGLLLVPGILFFFYSQFVAQVLVVEKLGVIPAFKTSWNLVRTKIWPLVVLFLTVEIGQGIISGIFSSIIFRIIPSAQPSVVEWLVGTVVAILVYVPIAVMYLERSQKQAS